MRAFAGHIYIYGHDSASLSQLNNPIHHCIFLPSEYVQLPSNFTVGRLDTPMLFHWISGSRVHPLTYNISICNTSTIEVFTTKHYLKPNC